MRKLGLCCIIIGLTACTTVEPQAEPTPTLDTVFETADAVVLPTFQADAESTAASVGVTAEIGPPPLPYPTAPGLQGTPLAQRTGACPVPEGYTLEQRVGFCIAVPGTWTIQNVDGGLAAALETTPGQAIGLLPEWAGADASICQVTVYIAEQGSAQDHLAARFREFQERAGLAELTPNSIQSPDGFAVSGFEWATGGRFGGVYAAQLSPNRLVHISHSGTTCALENLLPVLQTLRFTNEG
ncbi:MAG: hypothetical protein ACFB51_04315 [Anaerolineae bacterium]